MLISFHVYLFSSFLFFSLQIKELNQLGQQEKPDYFSCKGMIVYLKKESCLYTVLTYNDIRNYTILWFITFRLAQARIATRRSMTMELGTISVRNVVKATHPSNTE